MLHRPGLLAVVAGYILAACTPPQNALRIAPDATTDSLTFILTSADTTGVVQAVYGLSVVVCGTERAMWTIAADGSRSIPSRLVYGRAPEGFVVQTGPEPLVRGCYDVVVTSARPVRFHVDRSGAVHVPDH